MNQLSLPDGLQPRKYQQDAIISWMNAGGQGILNMATGTGKTITSLIAASELYTRQDQRLALVVAAPYQHLVDQWVEELSKYGASPIRAYQSKDQWIPDVSSAITEFATGGRDLLTIVTTHKTCSANHFQNLISRLNGSQALFIADEVHHMGAPHLRKGLPTKVRARLGLSATPERWHDDEGTNALVNYFTGGIVYEYGIKEAIDNGYLCKYYYIPHVINLTADESEDYHALSKAIGRRIGSNDVEDLSLKDDESLQHLLFKRARLIGTAQNKIETLRSLLIEVGPESLHHSLVYCGDGRMDFPEAEPGQQLKRQLRVVTELVGNELGIRSHQFTYEEDQKTRERLLSEFETGELQLLVAIRCLDEGVDIPATQTAFILSSSTNPRQFIQRRGRILRTHESKQYATIHDFVVVPSITDTASTMDSVQNIERNLLKRELKRVSMFAQTARNHPDAELDHIPTTPGSIRELKREFNLLDV